MNFVEFERRVRTSPPLMLSPFYWNAMLPETTGLALLLLFILPTLRAAAPEKQP